jgi:tRNA(fMet)-specific endonuclease VapC
MSLQYLIDTDWVIHYLHAHAAIVARLDELQPQGLALSIISLAELYEGVYYSRDPEGDEQDLADFLRGVTVLGLDTDIAKTFGRERGRLRAAGILIGDLDLFIAATALQHNLTLLTNNRRHFERIDGLRMESAE